MLIFLFFIFLLFSTLSLEHQNSSEVRGLGKHSAASLPRLYRTIASPRYEMWTLKGVDVSFLPPKKLTTRTGANNRLLFVSASAGFRATPLSKKTIKKRISESQFYWLTCSL